LDIGLESQIADARNKIVMKFSLYQMLNGHFGKRDTMQSTSYALPAGPQRPIWSLVE